jgi:hypothetical protein
MFFRRAREGLAPGRNFAALAAKAHADSDLKPGQNAPRLCGFTRIKKPDSLIFSKRAGHPRNPERSTMPEDAEAAPTPQQGGDQASIAKPDATSTATSSDELSVDDLAAVAGGLTGESLTSLDLSSLIGGPLKAPGV